LLDMEGGGEASNNDPGPFKLARLSKAKNKHVGGKHQNERGKRKTRLGGSSMQKKRTQGNSKGNYHQKQTFSKETKKGGIAKKKWGKKARREAIRKKRGENYIHLKGTEGVLNPRGTGEKKLEVRRKTISKMEATKEEHY